MSFLPKNPSESFKRLNPQLYESKSNFPAVRPVDALGEKPGQRSALVGARPKRQTRKGNVVVVITLVTCRTREADDDNNIASLKPLRDAIAASLGIDDGDSRIRWQYGQQETRGETGVIVKIENV